MALTANANLEQFIDDQLARHDVKAAVLIYRNAYVGRDPAGNVGPFILGDEFVGIAYEKADNTDGAAGVDPATSHPASLTQVGKINVWQYGDWIVTLTGVTKLDIGKPVFATDDGTVTLSATCPRGFVGYLIGVHDTNLGVVRLKEPGTLCDKDKLPQGAIHQGGRIPGHFVGTGATAGPVMIGDIYADSVVGLGVEPNGVAPGARLEFDNGNEAAFATLETQVAMDPTNGMYAKCEVDLDTWAGSACDLDFGFMGTLSDTERVSFVASASRASIHADGASQNLLCESDDTVTDVTVVDSTVDAANFDVLEVVCRSDGTIEFYINGVRVLSSTAFALKSTVDHAGALVVEKTTGTQTAVVDVSHFEVMGAA